MAASNLRYVIYDSQDENFVYIEYWIDDDFGLTLSSVQPVPRDIYQAYEDGAGISVRHNQTDEYLIYQRPAKQFYRYSSNFDPVGFGWYAYAPFPFIAVQEINFVLRALSAGMLPSPSTSDDLVQGVTNLYMTTFEKSKLSGIAAGAEVNVNANWDATFGDARILNKPDIFLNRYDAEANTARQEADATLIIERYVTVQADGHGEETAAQGNTPSEDNKIVRKIWHKATAFEDSDVTTWTLAHRFADNTAYIDTIDTFQELLTAATYGSIPLTLAQTWENVAEYEGPLDIVPGAAVALSAARLLRSDYTGPLIRVRRASDSAEQDIGFDGGGLLDTSALATFCSGTDGFVKVWYDQSGNGNNATQTATASQPKVYDSVTGVVTENGRAAVQGISSTSYLTFNSPIIGASDYSIYTAHSYLDVDMLFGGNTPTIGLWHINGGFGQRFNDGTNINLSGSFVTGDGVLSYQNRVSGSWEIAVNGETSTTGTNTADFTIDRLFTGFGTGYKYDGRAQEFIFYNSDQSANRAAIEANINAFYNIY